MEYGDVGSEVEGRDPRCGNRPGESRRELAIGWAALATITVIAMALPHAIGFLPSGLYNADYVFLADAAERMRAGQVQGIDFRSPIGPLIPWLMAIARNVWPALPDLLVVNSMLWAICILPLGWALARLDRVETRLIAVLLVAAAVLMPFNVEVVRDNCAINYNGLYNRVGAAFLIIIFLGGADPRRTSVLDGVMLFVLLSALFFIKVTYGIAASAYVIAGAIVAREQRSAAAVAFGLSAVLAAVVEMAGGSVVAYARDVRYIADLNRDGMLARLASFAMSEVAASVAVVVLVCLLAQERHVAMPESGGRARLPDPGSFLCLFAVPLVFWTESQSTGGVGLLPLAVFGLLPRHSSPWQGAGARAAALALAVVAAIPFLEQTAVRGRCVASGLPEFVAKSELLPIGSALRVLPGLWRSAEITAALWTARSAPVEDAYAAGFDFSLDSYGSPVSFLSDAIVADAAAREFKRLGLGARVKSVTTLGFVDEFSPRLGLTPPVGVTIALDPGRTIAAPSPSQAEAYLAHVDGVFERTCAVQPWQAELVRMFRAELSARFEPLQLTPCWKVHLRTIARPDRSRP